VKKARELWYRGVDAFRNGHYEDARQAFAECYALMPKSDVLRNLAISEIQSGHNVSAARHLTTLLSVPGELPPSVREEATHRLSQAEAQIGKLNVTVDVAGAGINVDGSPIGHSPLEGAWYLEPGQHEVTVSKSGYPVETRQIFALAGVAIPVSVSLEALRREQARDAHAAELMGTREGETPRDRGTLSTASAVTLISAGTVAALGLAGGIYFTSSANSHNSKADGLAGRLAGTDACNRASLFAQDCERLWREQADAHNDRQRALVSFVGFGVASAFTLGYALWLVLDSDDDDSTHAARRIEPSLAVGPAFAGINLHAQF
jgi:hypothetical protein